MKSPLLDCDRPAERTDMLTCPDIWRESTMSGYKVPRAYYCLFLMQNKAVLQHHLYAAVNPCIIAERS